MNANAAMLEFNLDARTIAFETAIFLEILEFLNCWLNNSFSLILLWKIGLISFPFVSIVNFIDELILDGAGDGVLDESGVWNI